MDDQDHNINRVPLVSLPDSYPAWTDGIPKIPDTAEANSSGKIYENIYNEDI